MAMRWTANFPRIVYWSAALAMIAFALGSKATRFSDFPVPENNFASETNSVLAVRDWEQKGFLRHYALPKYYSHFSGPAGDSVRDVYTHYLPGSEWTAFAMAKVCGSQNVRCWRWAPLLANALGLLALFGALLMLVAPVGALLVLAGVLALPLTTHLADGLGYEGYAQALLLMTCAVLVLVRRVHLKLATLMLLGFSMAIYSLDYFFLVGLLPIPLGLIQKKKIREIDWECLALFGSFLFACAMHFGQVVLLFGSVPAALAEFIQSGKQRCCGIAPGAYVTPDLFPLVQRFITDPRTFGGILPVLVLAIAITMACIQFYREKKIGEDSAKRWVFALFSSFVIAALWTAVMREHSLVHPLTARHFFLPVLLGAIFLARKIPTRQFTSFS